MSAAHFITVVTRRH